MRVAPPAAAGRLLRRSDFVAAAKGRKFHTPRMSVQGLGRDDEVAGPGARIGFTLTRKVGHATERNRMRRRLRAAAAAAIAGIAARPVDLVVIGRRDALAAPFPVLVEDLSRAFAAVARPGRAGRVPETQPGRHAK